MTPESPESRPGAGPGKRRAWKPVLTLAAAALLAAGCSTTPVSSGKMTRYRPNVADRGPVSVARVSRPSVPPPAAPVPALPAPPAPGPAPSETKVSVPDPPARPASPAETNVASARMLKRGDKVKVSLRGIPTPEEIISEIDEMGVNLPWIGRIRIDGMTVFEAEKRIEKAYVDAQVFTKINVIIVMQEDEYFVQGEVTRPGKYIMTGDRTLLQAISEAGSFTDFAKRWRIQVKRGTTILYFDAEKIADNKEKDPLIKSGDTIIVPRRFW